MRPGFGDRQAKGLQARRQSPAPSPAADLGAWERKRLEEQQRDAAHLARQAREALAQRVFRALATCERVQVVLVEGRRPCIHGCDDRGAKKILLEHPQGLVGVYTRACAWHDLLADLEAAGL